MKRRTIDRVDSGLAACLIAGAVLTAAGLLSLGLAVGVGLIAIGLGGDTTGVSPTAGWSWVSLGAVVVGVAIAGVSWGAHRLLDQVPT